MTCGPGASHEPFSGARAGQALWRPAGHGPREPFGRAGEIHALIGPNGAGKTTLVNQISGLLAPDAGRIMLGGQDLTHLPMHRRVALGLSRCFQVTRIFPNQSVRDNLVLAVQAHSGSSFRFLQPRSSFAWLVRTRRATGRAGGPAAPAGRTGGSTAAWRPAHARRRPGAGSRAQAVAAGRAHGRHGAR